MTRAALAYKMHFLETSVAVQSENKASRFNFRLRGKSSDKQSAVLRGY